MGTGVSVRVLGGVEAVTGGGPVDLGGPRQRRLLAALALDVGRVVSLDQLTDRIWGDDQWPADPRRTVRTYLTRLRRALGADDAVHTEPEGWRLDPSIVELDVTRFEELVAEAETPGCDVHTRLALLDGALSLFRGRPYGDLADEMWLRVEVERLEELRVTVTERRYDAMLAAGKHTDAVPGLVAEVEAHPLRDRLVGLHMLALFRSGRQAEAGRVFQAHRARLAEESGLEPGAELVELDRRIVSGDPSLQLGTAAGQPLRGYRLGEQLGEGAFAVVYRGTQPSVGRDVAVKVIRSELANQPDFIRRFEAEAYLVARLEHPRIVPLYDYWREPSRACLVFRHLRGGSLEAELTRSGPLSLDDAVRLVDHVGSALEAAHAAGVVHRDVKPANVFLDGDGNFYLGDFGIALQEAELSNPSAALSAGSPAYASPEQLRRDPVGPTADVHGLGITIYEALTGKLPFPDAVNQADLLQRQLHDPLPSLRLERPDLPQGLDAVVARATAKDPAERYPRVLELVDDFVAAVEGDRVAPGPVGRAGAATIVGRFHDRNPYKGLRAFTEADAADFHGRERLVLRLTEMLGRDGTAGKIAAVIGPSGIGKSSVVRAGLLPALRRGRVPGSDQWFVATMLPGSDPFEELGAALLRVANHVPENMMSLLSADHRGIARVVKALVPEDSDIEVLVVIDQFEELFTLVDDEQVRRRFLDGLEHALADARCRLRVVLTMRADFWDRPLRHGSFARLIEGSTVHVTALAPDELELAITEPARSVGGEFEPGLVSQIVADVTDEPGALPLLQYALTELWDRQVSGLLTRDAYRQLGGVSGALARRAEELFVESDEDEQVVLRRLFGRLVTLGEGSADTRRRVRRSELGDGRAVDASLERFGAARLLSFDRDPASREPTVEVAHEALIREWPRLRTWLEEDRDGLRILRHLTESAAAWDASGRDVGELYRGGRLEAAEEWAATRPEALTPLETEFLEASVQVRTAEEAAERQRFEAERRSNRRLRRLLTGVAILAAVAMVAGTLAFQQRGAAQDNAASAAEASAEAVQSAAMALTSAEEADRARAEAETRRLVADAASLVGENRDVALLLASEAYRRDPGPQTLAGLQRVLTNTGSYMGTVGQGRDFWAGGWLRDGTIVGLTATSLEFYDGATGASRKSLNLPSEVATVPLGSPAFSITGDTVAVGFVDGSVLVVEGEVKELLETSDVGISAVAISTDLGLIAVGDVSGAVHLLDQDSGEERWTKQVILDSTFADLVANDHPLLDSLLEFDDLVFGTGPRSLVFEEDAGTVLVAADAHLRRLDLDNGSIQQELLLESTPNVDFVPPFARAIWDMRVGADGTIVVVAGTSAVARVDQGLAEADWGVAPTGRASQVSATSMDLDSTGAPWFGLNNGQLATGIVSDFTAGADPSPTGLATVRGVALSADGREVMVAGPGGLVFRSIDGQQLLGRAVPLGGNNEITISRDGDLVIASNIDLQIETLFYDLSGPTPVAVTTMAAPLTDEFYADGDPLGRYAFTWNSISGLTGLLDRRTLRPVGITFSGPATFSPDGLLVATSDRGGSGPGEGVGPVVSVATVASGDRASPDMDLGSWRGDDAFGDFDVRSLVFTPDAQRLFVSLTSGTTVIFDLVTGEVVAEIQPDDSGGGAVAARFSRDGTVLVTRGIDGSIAVRDPTTLDVLRTIQGGTSAAELISSGPYVSPDGEYLLTTRDQAPRLWHLPTDTMIGTFPHDPSKVATGNDFGDELRLVTAINGDGIIWNLKVEEWPAIACRAAGRNLTPEEWEQFGPAGEPYQATCPEWPALA